jgi:hypothetical protein
MRSGLLVGEVEYLEVYRHPTNAATNLEWIDTLIDEVTEELSPRPFSRLEAYQTPGSPARW